MTKMRRSKKTACTIMISCEEPSADGQMQVQMTCEGDEVLASYLLQNAQVMLDNSLVSNSKLTPFEEKSI